MDKSFWYIGTKDVLTKTTELETTYLGYFLKYHDNGKFKKDHIFSKYKDCFIILDGVVFNKIDLSQGYSNWIETIYALKDEDDFPNMLRGSFSGAIVYDDGRLQVFTDHCGDKPVFIFENECNRIICTELIVYKNMMNEGKISLSPYKSYFRYMLSYGFMIDNGTCYNEIKRLMPAQIMTFYSGHSNLYCYHKFDNTNVVDMSDDTAIAYIDKLFRNAIKLEFDKDLEYGYRHLVDISGGLDCRIVNYVVKDMGYKNILNITYSQVNSNEFKASLKMVKHLGNELIFYPLDKANFIFDVDKITKMNNGLCMYATSTGVSKILDLINMDHFGIEHGGLLGDIRDGSFPGNNYYEQVDADVSKGMQFSGSYKMDKDVKEISSQYLNQELFDVYTRGMLGGLSTIMIRNYYIEYFAPFMDPDFYDFYLSMPLEQRVRREIFKKWIEKYYPQAFVVEDDRLMCRMDAPKYKKILAKIKSKMEREVFRFGMKHDMFYRQNSMNPFEYWYKTKPDIQKFIKDYYNEYKYLLNDDIELKNICAEIIKKENLRDMTMVLSILSVLKIYFNFKCEEI